MMNLSRQLSALPTSTPVLVSLPSLRGPPPPPVVPPEPKPGLQPFTPTVIVPPPVIRPQQFPDPPGSKGGKRFLAGALAGFFGGPAMLIWIACMNERRSHKYGSQTGFGASLVVIGIILVAIYGRLIATTPSWGYLPASVTGGGYTALGFGIMSLLVGVPMISYGIFQYWDLYHTSTVVPLAGMITPPFEVTQDDDFVVVRMRIQFLRPGEMDFYIVGNEFKFVMPPYFLRLFFPGPLVEDGREKAVHHQDSATMEVFLPKQNRGQVFPDLDIPTRLLPPARSDRAQLIEVLQSEESADAVPDETPEPDLSTAPGIGFDGGHNVLTRSELGEAVVPHDLMRSQDELAAERFAAEQAKFDPVYYMLDFIEDGEVEEALALRCWWDEPEVSSGHMPFTARELDELRALPNRQFVLRDAAVVLATLCDLLAAYAYDMRTTGAQHTCESGWTLATLAASLSWLWRPPRPAAVPAVFTRRVLTYPLRRHAALARRCLHDAARIIGSGRRPVLRALLEMRRVLRADEARLPLVPLFLDEYCAWAVGAPSDGLRTAAAELVAATEALTPEQVGWDLRGLEEEAIRRLVQTPAEDMDDRM